MTLPRKLLSACQLFPKKQLGQNFLSDPSTARMIVSRARITPDDAVLEIGAGLGALTVPLSQTAHHVYAVEKDHQLIDLLKAELTAAQADNVTLFNENILKVNIPEISARAGRPLVVLGNLPYNISSQILIQLIKARHTITHCALMFQKELARRLAAGPDNKDYGRITVMLQYCAAIRSLATVEAPLFYPRPKIDSEVLEIDFTRAPDHGVHDEDFFFAVVKAAFSKRRKTLKNALSQSELKMDADSIVKGLDEAQIDPKRRAETLRIEEFVALANRLYGYRDED